MLFCCCRCCLSPQQGQRDGQQTGGKFVVRRALVLSDVRTSGLHLCTGKGERGEESGRPADSEDGNVVRSFKALIASGKRSHFPNHIHAPIIYFLPPAPALLCLTHSLSLSAVPWPPLSLHLPVPAFVQSSPVS